VYNYSIFTTGNTSCVLLRIFMQFVFVEVKTRWNNRRIQSFTVQVTWLASSRSKAQAHICLPVCGASWWVLLQHSIMLQLFFIIECGIARFLCIMCVFKVRASSSSLRLPLCQILVCSVHCWASPWRKIAYSITHSITPLIWCSGNRST